MSLATETAGRVALITGVTGQDGSYLAELLLSKGYTVWGMVRRSSTRNTQRIEHLLETAIPPQKSLNLCEGDLADAGSITNVIRTIKPDEVYNLGAQSHVGVSFQVPKYTADVTGLGAIRILQALRDLGLPARYYQASSSEVFGREPAPQSETTRINPCNPYGAAKSLALHMTRIYRQSYGMFAVNGILFNHESPRRGETFVTRKITRAVGEILRGSNEPLRLGNLDACRDWGFAGDYVDAMWRMLQLPTPEDFVIATGETHSVREFCELAFAHVGLPIHWEGTGIDEQGRSDDGRLLVVVDPKFFRPLEIDLLQGDPTYARESLGWQPTVTFEQLVQMMVDADR